LVGSAIRFSLLASGFSSLIDTAPSIKHLRGIWSTCWVVGSGSGRATKGTPETYLISPPCPIICLALRILLSYSPPPPPPFSLAHSKRRVQQRPCLELSLQLRDPFNHISSRSTSYQTHRALKLWSQSSAILFWSKGRRGSFIHQAEQQLWTSACDRASVPSSFEIPTTTATATATAPPHKPPHSLAAHQGSAGASTTLCTSPHPLPSRNGRVHNIPLTSIDVDILCLLRKFGKQIQKRQLEVPEYAASFVNYKALKKVCPI